MSDAAALQAKIRQTIPLSVAMDYRIVELDSTHIVVEAPLQPNMNLHGTGFAGSIYALGMLSAWALANHLIDKAGLIAELVATQASIRYQAPIREAIRCRCRLNADQGRDFVARLRTRARARIDVEVEIGRQPAAVLQVSLHASSKCSSPRST